MHIYQPFCNTGDTNCTINYIKLNDRYQLAALADAH